MACSAVLVVLSWAEALDDTQLAVKSSFLNSYRKFYYMILVERFVNGSLFCISAADIGGSYLVIYRIYLAQWSLFTFILAIAIVYYGLQMRKRLQNIRRVTSAAVARVRLISFGPISAISYAHNHFIQLQTTRLTVLYFMAATIACVFTAIQCGLEGLANEQPVLWFIFMGAYHMNITLLATWFIIGRPHQNELIRRAAEGKSKTTGTASSSVANDGSARTRQISDIETHDDEDDTEGDEDDESQSSETSTPSP